jgi:hypothetical protein
MPESEVERNQRDTIDNLQRRCTHLERMVSSHLTQDWEKFKQGDLVIIDNSDSEHDNQIGYFFSHNWRIGGWCELIVEFQPGELCCYLPSQVRRHFKDEQQPVKLAPVIAEDNVDPSIVAKLKQLQKIPQKNRLAILKGSLDSSLHTQAIAMATAKGLI